MLAHSEDYWALEKIVEVLRNLLLSAQMLESFEFLFETSKKFVEKLISSQIY